MRAVSLFSGAGGLDLGLIQAGHEVVWANDWDADAVETYRQNIGHNIVCKDIAKIKSADIPDSDVVVGGFPCQGFSRANWQRAKGDQRNKLYRQLLRVIRDKKPLYFLAENVRGILSFAGGKAIKQILRDFSNAGYRVKYKLFNLADYGIPQSRNRVIIAGTLKALSEELDYNYPKPTHCDPTKCKEANLLPWVTISKALRGIPEPQSDSSGLPNHICSQYKVTNRDFTGHRLTVGNKPSPTILARGNGEGGVCVVQHPKNHRRLSVRETAIIQTFPLDFEFVGSMTSCYRQVGNAVSVLFAKHLGKELKLLERKLKSLKRRSRTCA